MLDTELNKKPKTLSFQPSIILHNPIVSLFCLESASTILLVDMAISLLFLAVLEQHRGGENQSYIDTHDTEGTSKDEIEEVVTK
jgi:hypothetical protein